MMHGIHGWNGVRVSVQTHLAVHHLEFPRNSYGQNIEDYSENRTVTRKCSRALHEEALSH
jgi:hypothetical protein